MVWRARCREPGAMNAESREPGPRRADVTKKRVQWSSPWVIGFGIIAALDLTGMHDRGFFYLERQYYAPWSIGGDALTGSWQGALREGSRERRMLLSIALLPKARLSHHGEVSHDVWTIDGQIQLVGVLTLCSSSGSQERYDLRGYATGTASDVELWAPERHRGERFAFESLSGAWRGRTLPVSISYAIPAAGADRAGFAASERKQIASVTFHKLEDGVGCYKG